MHHNYIEIDLFRGKDISEFFGDTLRSIKAEINSTPKSGLTDESSLVSTLFKKYSLSGPIAVDLNSRTVEPQGEHSVDRRDEFGEYYKQTVKQFLVSYNFTGEPKLFSLKPSVYSFGSSDPGGRFMLSQTDSRFGFLLQAIRLEADAFEQVIANQLKKLSSNLPNINHDLVSFNNELKSVIMDLVKNKIREGGNEDDFLAKLNRPRK